MNYLLMLLFLFVVSSSTTTLILNSSIIIYAQESTTTSSQNNQIVTPEEKSSSSLNIAVAADWGCNGDAKKTSENIQNKNPELVIAGGDLSYGKSANCWDSIISPFESKLKVSMGDHEYHDTQGGKEGVINDYLEPLNLAKTYYSFDLKNTHFVFIDPYLDYKPGSPQYQFIEQNLKTAFTNPKIDWTFVVEHIPLYTSPSKHPADSTIRDIYQPLFDKYGVDLVFSGDNHNYQRTFPLKYNSKGEGDSSNNNNPIIADKDSNNYRSDSGGEVIYLITGTAGRSHYAITQQAPFIAKQDDKHFGFLNIAINGKTLKGTFYANEIEQQGSPHGNDKNNVIDYFTISKI
jgi:Calcineurin-like phosphoesterase